MSKPKIVLKKLKALDKIWHPESSLVFKSLDDKKVIGRYSDNEFISLDEVALQLCVDWNFAYDPDLVEEASDMDDKSETQHEPEPDVETSQEHETEPEPVSVCEPEQSAPTKEEEEEVEVESKQSSDDILLECNKKPVVETNTNQVDDEFKAVMERCNLLYYSKVSAYEELEKKYNELTVELKETKITLSDIINKFENIKKFLQ